MSRYEPTRYEYIFKNLEGKKGTYYFRGTVNGRFIDKSLKTDLITKAKDRADKLRADPEAASIRVRRTFDDAFDLVLKEKQVTAWKTEEQAQDIINNHLRPWFKEHCPFIDSYVLRYKGNFAQLHKAIWADYQVEGSGRKVPKYLKTEAEREAFLRKNPKPRKLDHDRRFLVTALQRAHVAGWIKRNFEKKDFPLNEVKEEIGQYIPDAEVQEILDGLRHHPKSHLQVLIAVTMGMRKLEILHLSRLEIDLSKREINLDVGRIKTRKRREVPIPISDAVYPLVKAAYEAALGPYIFPAIMMSKPGRPLNWNKPQDDNGYHWDKVRIETGIDVRFHDLRHTAITNMIKSGMSDVAIRKVCGVSEEVMRRIYAHMDQDLKSQFRGLFKGKFS